LKAGAGHAIPHFPPEGLQFLRSLKRNNKRDWFQERKQNYEEFVRAPMEAIVEALAPELERFAPDIAASVKLSLFRIYRDTRFSKDKSPYKTHVAASFPPTGMAKHQGAGFYFHIAPTEFFIGGGLYSPDPKDVLVVREHIAERFRQFESIISSPRFRRAFGDITGAQLVRVPQGYPKDHPAAHFLKFKQFLATRSLPVTAATTSSFGSTVLDTFRTLYPFISFLNEPIRRTQKLRERRDLLMR
jgi:uncharacterized protein (TIGR02453 family)